MIHRNVLGLTLGAVLVLAAGGEVVESHHRCGHGNYSAQHPEECGTPPPPPPPPDPGWPPVCLGTPTSNFTRVETVEVPVGSHMFGRPLAAAYLGGDIVLAVGARPSQVHIYTLDPTDGTLRISDPEAPNPITISIDDVPQKVVVGEFDSDGVPDFVVAGFGDVEVLKSLSGYVPTFLHSEADSIAATDGYIAVGVGGGRRDFGDVFVYDSSSLTLVDVVSGLDAGSPKGGQFGRAVGFGDVLSPPPNFEPLPDGKLDLIVGAPSVDLTKKIKNIGEMWVFSDVLGDQDGQLIPGGALNEENFAWQVAVVDDQVLAATKWTNPQRRVQVYDDLPASTIALEPAAGSLGDGWASGGMGHGSINSVPSAIVGAPNANCDGEGSTGVGYLYVGLSPAPEIFVPPDAIDPDSEPWNAFGWSADIVSTGGSASFVVIGEPGRDFPVGGSSANDGRVYVYQHTP